MKRVFSLIALCFSLAANSQPSDTSAVSGLITMWNAAFGKVEGKSLPHFSATTLEGKQITNRDITAKATFLNLWFATCQPCIKEIPHLKRLYNLFKDSANVKFYGVTYESKDKAQEFIEKYGINFPVLLVSKEVGQQLTFGRGYPTNLLLNARGKIYTAYQALSYPNDVVETYFKPSLDKLLQGSAGDDDSLLNNKVNTQNIRFIDSSRKITSLSQLLAHFKDKSLYVDLWASWCLPCRYEFLVKNSVDTFLKNHQIDRLFISVDKPEARAKWKDLIYSIGLEGVHLLAEEALIIDLKRHVYVKGEDSSIPRYLLIKNGKLVERAAYRPSEEQKLISQLSEKLLGN